MTSAGLYWRTLSRLSPLQVAWRVRLRIQRQLFRWVAEDRLHALIVGSRRAEGCWPSTFTPLDRQFAATSLDPAMLRKGVFESLGIAAPICTSWNDRALPQLWRYQLHYWDWVWQLLDEEGAAGPDADVSELWRSWTASNRLGEWDAWSPYVVSLRLWTLCGIAHHPRLGDDVRGTLPSEIARHDGYLRRNLERDVGGNHLMKNLKGLIGADVYADDRERLSGDLRELEREIDRQVLADGGHFELSTGYHAQVLGDLVDLAGLLRGAGLAVPDFLATAVERMRGWLSALTIPDGSVPALNDAHQVEQLELSALGVEPPETSKRLTVLPDSGYIVVRPTPDVCVVIDVGMPCPDELPAHAQADCLSFVLCIGDRQLIVDTGTSEYGYTSRRRYERSTAAHNTVCVGSTDQTEVWGAFRAGRRAVPSVLAIEDRGDCVLVDAEHDGYRHLPGRPMHRRQFLVSERSLEIRDVVRGSGLQTVESNLVCLTRAEPVQNASGTSIEVAGLILDSDRTFSVRPDRRARSFGDSQSVHVVSQRSEGAAPLQLGVTISWASL